MSACAGSFEWEHSPLPRRHIGPQRFELIGLEEIAPRRHLVLAADDRAEEALALVVRKFPQVECAAGVLHARAVARRAVDCVNFSTGADLLLVEVFLGRCRCANQQKYQPSRNRKRTAFHGSSLTSIRQRRIMASELGLARVP